MGQALSGILSAQFRTIDDCVPKGSGAMSDEQVDLALSKLFEMCNPIREIVEFCHHDYVGLLRGAKFQIFNDARKVVFLTPLDVCLDRNSLRSSPVQKVYVERAWQSTHDLLELYSPVDPCLVLPVDTSGHLVDSTVADVAKFITGKV